MPEETAEWPADQPLRLQKATVRRGDAVLLDAIDLELPARSRLVLVGPSGAGKSTLIRLLNRLEDPTSGRVTHAGRDLRRLPIGLVRCKVGVVFQSPRPLPGTVAENLAYPLVVRDRPRPSDDQLAAMLADVGLSHHWLKRDADGLSGGERQRLAVAQALAIGPEILALDEPTSALDPASARLIADLLGDLCEARGLRTLVVTHHRGHAAMLGETAALLERGRIIAQGPMKEVLHRADRDGADA